MPTGVYERKPRPVAASVKRTSLTPAQRKAISDRLKAFHRNKKREESNAPEITDSQAAYALGRVQGWLEAYADGIGVSGHALAGRVGDLLRTSSRRKGVGS